MHWTMMVAFVQAKKICYLDSMGGSGRTYTSALLKYFSDEAKAKGKTDVNIQDWTVEYCNCGSNVVQNLPQQQNGTDCGMFSIYYADFLSDDLPFDFSQDDIPEFRRKVCAAILKGDLNYSIL